MTLPSRSILKLTEVCDGIDNDCGGLINEADNTYYYVNGNGYGNANAIIQGCVLPPDYVMNNADKKLEASS